MKWVSLKLAVLLLLTTAPRGSEIVALTVKDLEFSANDEQVTIYPDPTFVPKTVDELQRKGTVGFGRLLSRPEHEGKKSVTTCPVQSKHCVFIKRARRLSVGWTGCYCHTMC